MFNEGYVLSFYNTILVGNVRLHELLNYTMIFTKVHRINGDMFSSPVKV